MGKGGGPLSVWIKEFTALVFTQTVQAFIYAIIISVILLGMGGKNATGVSANDNNSALGLMATFALLSVFKVEEMVKKIFGLSDTKASPGNAMKSIAKTAFAVQLGKRVLDNAGKFAGGIRNINKSRQDLAKAKKRHDEDLADYGLKFENGQYVKSGKGGVLAKPTGSGGASGAGSASGRSAAEEKYYAKAMEAKKNGDMDAYRANMDKAAFARTLGNSSGGGASGGGSSSTVDVGGMEISGADYRRIKNATRAFEDKIDEVKKARNEGIKSIASSLAESTGAIFGGATGGLLAGADGNFDEMARGIVAGMGVGDSIGKSTIDSLERATQFIQRNIQDKPTMSVSQANKIVSELKSAQGKLNVNHSYKSNSVDDVDT